MDEVVVFGEIVLVVGAGVMLALGLTKLTERVPLPSPALFLLLAALASDLFPELGETLGIRDVERIAVVALVVILFDGGTQVGWRRFQASAWPIMSLGIVGTFATAGVMAVAAHVAFDFDWTTAWILGAALAPTDPAVMFSVLGNREVGGRSGTILEGESGANDPVGIALMIGMVEYATHADAGVGGIAVEFGIEMAVGLAIGLAGAAALVPLTRRVSLANESHYPLLALAAALVIYGVASAAHGSGFLAVFVAGLLLGDADLPFKAETRRFQGALASLAEVVVFVALGLTVEVAALGEDSAWVDGLLLAVVLAFVARPLVALVLLLPAELRWGERLFVAWSGLKGAVPILLAAFALLGGVDEAERIYRIVFVVVAFSVVVQGSLVPLVARRFGVPMRIVGGPAEARPPA